MVIDRTDSLWYKDAIIYELHVRAFYDSNGDGIGDFAGLLQKLDYLQELGISAIWLLPFYPSPLMDDGYDITDYRGIHPDYGTLKDFKTFLKEAHKRGIRVITELVVNHTSIQHPWFQAARRARKNSAQRNFYVWNDTDDKFPETRIIFTDTETSNWAWDPVASQYYWHRFFSHQADLNLNNPKVVQAVGQFLKYWLDMGVDGLRLDAVPYLCVREGTNNENLPETHEVIKTFRRLIDQHYNDRMLLAEANQWPEDVRPYFGDGDECHMAFHFPLMPRLFMALAQADSFPIVDIMEKTPAIPDIAQWGLFLRNHDELTLEMVTDDERDFMYQEFAADPRMRVNIGIRRRLAPLVDNNPQTIKMLNSILFSFPGSPIIYYGDEIGMGDNIYLGDRNAVRTPMQWSIDRNGGFSMADPARLYHPVIMDPVYGYQSVNVEAQMKNQSSLFHFMKQIIGLRRQYKAFGRGSLTFLHPENHRILAYLRRYKHEVLLCVVNLCDTIQPVNLDLSEYAGSTPLEMFGRTEFPTIGQTPYFLSLPPHGFYWFKIVPQAKPIGTLDMGASFEKTMPKVVIESGRDSIWEMANKNILEKDAFPRFLPNQHWFIPTGQKISQTHITDWVKISANFWITFVNVSFEDGSEARYCLPLRIALDKDAERILEQVPKAVVCLVNIRQEISGVLYDAFLTKWPATFFTAPLKTAAIL
ncbi:MAG: maltose alpha-D-glucosyltransferase [Vampirovibrionales bacterium]